MNLKDHVLNDSTVRKVLDALCNKDVTTATDDCDYYKIAQACGVTFNNNGETKNVFLHAAWDFVLKFTNNSYDRVDYPALEAKNYEVAKQRGIEKILLETVEIYTINDLHIFAQWKYQRSLGEYTNREFKVLRGKLNNLYNRPIVNKCLYGCLDGERIYSLWMARAIQIYGKKFIREFEQFTRECKVNDLHHSNLGFYNNKPVIFDYAGYHGYSTTSY